MKNFLITNIDTVSVVVGVLIFIIMSNLFDYVNNTKFEDIHKWYFIGLMLIGVISSSVAIGKWIIK